MDETDPHLIDSLEELRTLYELPMPIITASKLDYIHPHMQHFIGLSPFVCIASESDSGLDVSPRGGTPGFVRVLDRKTVAFGDWPGNNKLETFSNILRTRRCGLLFLVPTLDLFLRINGPAVLTRAPELVEALTERGRLPKLAVKVTVNEAYYHCGKAFRRSGLWKPEKWQDAGAYPSVGRFLTDLVPASEFTPEQIDTLYEEDLRDKLY